MFFYIFLFYVLFITSAQSKNSSLHLIDQTNNKSVTAPITLLDNTNISLVSEGGTIKPKKPDISLPKSDFNSLVSLEEEFRKTKQKSVVPRKGVDNMLAADSALLESNKTQISFKNNTSTLQKLTTSVEQSSDNVAVPKQSNVTSEPVKTLVESKPVNVIKKPLILSYEALANMEKNIQNDQSKIAVVPSTKTLASSQIPSPNEDSKPKVYPSKANSHPGMIMPIVITILVVPMFAIVGYMALKRGQEAWKNRHYKRMDFLLDGMYND